MTGRTVVLYVLFALLLAPAFARHRAPGHHDGHQPYGGLERRAVKTLSHEQIADLRVGRGMGLALAAELNGYPGPRHVLDHARPLALTAAQRAKIEGLFEAMRQEAVAAGAAVIAAETGLDRLFATGQADEETLAAVMERVGHAHKVLRRIHLAYHLHTRAVLSPDQVARYNRLRGYEAK